ncbi:MAG: aKG-HExxH-type peptide beta-hydroxylase [Acidovorax sp.]|uniref:aKG-HExxH-type peptide beta-hydroxylase n=1 Tax=Acidovorax sp. TaxID=1872122 RepID=UPI00391DF60D
MKLGIKAAIYVVSDGHLLVFAHPEHPEVGYQIPSGTVKLGESVTTAAVRELTEETGLHIEERMLESLGIFEHDMRPFREERQQRHAFLVQLNSVQRSTWTHWEEHPDTSGAAPEPFNFHWEPLAARLPRLLAVGQGAPIAGWCVAGGVGNTQRIEYSALETTLKDALSRRRTALCNALALLFPELCAEISVACARGEPSGALLEHVVYRAQRAAAGQESLAAVLELLRVVLELPQAKHPLAIRSEGCLKVSDHGYETPLYLATAAAVSAELQRGGAGYSAAMELLQRSDFMYTVEGCVGLVIELADKALLEASDSYTLSGLPGTSFCDRVDSQLRRAESILHEATHTWLNIMLAERQPQGFGPEEYWSPWRHRLRPAHGILQATLVFSLLCQFFHCCLRIDEVGDVDKAYARARLRVEAGVLHDNVASISSVLAKVEDIALRSVLAEELNRALNLSF